MVPPSAPSYAPGTPCACPSRPREKGSHRSRAAGFTLLEVMVGLLIASVTMGSFAVLMQTTSDSTREISGNLSSLREGIEAFAALRHDLGRCSPVKASQDGLSLEYRVPVPAGPGGGFVDDTGEMVWGVNDRDGVHVDGSITLSFVRESILKEATDGKDLNGDGDLNDTFEVGHLERKSSAGHVLPLPKLTVLIAPTVTKVGMPGSFPGDLTGDGKPDPLFEYDRDHDQLILRVARFARGDRVRVLLLRTSMATTKSLKGG